MVVGATWWSVEKVNAIIINSVLFEPRCSVYYAKPVELGTLNLVLSFVFALSTRL